MSSLGFKSTIQTPQRVRRKHQRLPPSLLIESASNVILPLPESSSPEAFSIKASDNPGAGRSSSVLGVFAAFCLYQFASTGIANRVCDKSLDRCRVSHLNLVTTREFSF